MGVSIQQAVTYTAANLRDIELFRQDKGEALYNLGKVRVLSGSHFLLSRGMMVAAAFQMLADSYALAAHSIRNILDEGSITALALSSLGDSFKHLVLAICSITFGIISPEFVIGLGRLMIEFPKPVEETSLVLTCLKVAA